MLKFIAIAVVVAIAGVLLFANTRPDEFSVQRTLRIQAPPDRIAAQITDFHRWQAWSPYEKLDPGMTRSINGAQGVGATYGWSGEGKAGAGRMEITAATPSRITIALDFDRPFESHGNVAQFTLTPQGNATDVTWSMRGPQPYMAKVMGLIFNSERMVGGDFEQGLGELKRIVEG